MIARGFRRDLDGAKLAGFSLERVPDSRQCVLGLICGEGLRHSTIGPACTVVAFNKGTDSCWPGVRFVKLATRIYHVLVDVTFTLELDSDSCAVGSRQDVDHSITVPAPLR